MSEQNKKKVEQELYAVYTEIMALSKRKSEVDEESDQLNRELCDLYERQNKLRQKIIDIIENGEE